MKDQKNYGLGGLLIVCLTVFYCGCGRDEALPVAGTIQIDGKSVDKGLIIFETTDPNQPAVGARIDNGCFALAKGKGLLPGTYQVRVKALRRTGKNVFDRQANKEVEQLVTVPVSQAGISTMINRDNSQQLRLHIAAAKQNQ